MVSLISAHTMTSSLTPNQISISALCSVTQTRKTMSDSEDRQSPPALLPGRHEKSLGLLTTKFVELLQASEGGILDLKKVE